PTVCGPRSTGRLTPTSRSGGFRTGATSAITRSARWPIEVRPSLPRDVRGRLVPRRLRRGGGEDSRRAGGAAGLLQRGASSRREVAANRGKMCYNGLRGLHSFNRNPYKGIVMNV